jgi:hypothetical protein
VFVLTFDIAEKVKVSGKDFLMLLNVVIITKIIYADSNTLKLILKLENHSYSTIPIFDNPRFNNANAQTHQNQIHENQNSQRQKAQFFPIHLPFVKNSVSQALTDSQIQKVQHSNFFSPIHPSCKFLTF